jgi:hypothetical protein
VAATAAPTSEGRSLGSIYAAVDHLRENAEALFKSYEDDASVVELAQRALEIRIEASRLENTLDAIVGALDSLG